MARSRNGRICAVRPWKGATAAPPDISWASRCWAISSPKGLVNLACPGAMSEPRRCNNIAFSNEVESGSREENASNVKSARAVDNDGAKLVALLDREMSLRCVRQRELPGDVVQPRTCWKTCREPFRDIGLRRGQQRRRQRVQHQRAQRDAFAHQLAHRNDRIAVAVGGIDRDGGID